MNEDERIVELEVKVAFQEQRIAELDEALLDQSRRVAELEETVRLMKEALRRVRNEAQKEPVAGALPEEDPVPRSG